MVVDITPPPLLFLSLSLSRSLARSFFYSPRPCSFRDSRSQTYVPLFSLFLFFSLSNAPRLMLIFSRCFVVFSLFLSLLVAKPRQKAHPQRERKTRRRRISSALRSAAFTGRHVKATLKALTLQREKRRESSVAYLFIARKHFCRVAYTSFVGGFI